MAAKPSLVHAATCVSIAWLVSMAPAAAVAPEHRAAIAVLARFQDAPSAQVPAWTAQVFDPDRPGSFSHFYDTMSFGRHRVRGEVVARVYVAPGARADYQAGEATGVGGYGQFAREILRLADADIDFARFDNDGPDGVPNSGDDDGVVDAVFLLLAETPQRLLRCTPRDVAGCT